MMSSFVICTQAAGQQKRGSSTHCLPKKVYSQVKGHYLSHTIFKDTQIHCCTTSFVPFVLRWLLASTLYTYSLLVNLPGRSQQS
jgi:hypothetical protein